MRTGALPVDQISPAMSEPSSTSPMNRASGCAPKSAVAFMPGMKTWIDNTADKWYYLDVQEATNSHSYTVKGSETWTAQTSAPNRSLYE